MKSRRRKLTFAVQLIPIFLLLMFVAPQLSAQQDENHSSEPSSAPKAPSNQRPAASSRPATSHGNDKPDKRAAGQRSPSTNAPRQSGSSTDAATDDPGPSISKPGRQGSSTNAPGRTGSSTDAANDNSPATKGPGTTGLLKQCRGSAWQDNRHCRTLKSVLLWPSSPGKYLLRDGGPGLGDRYPDPWRLVRGPPQTIPDSKVLIVLPSRYQ